MVKKKTLRSIQPGFKPRSSELCSDVFPCPLHSTYMQSGCCDYPIHWWQHKVLRYSSCRVNQLSLRKIQPMSWTVSMDKCHLSSVPMPCRAPVAQLVRASNQGSEDPGSNPGWISMSFFITNPIQRIGNTNTQISFPKHVSKGSHWE